MTTLGRIGLCAIVALAASGLLPSTHAQSRSGSASTWTPAKTPWGHPDLQGVYTNKDEANTPLERPDQLAGRSAKDFSAADLAALAHRVRVRV